MARGHLDPGRFNSETCHLSRSQLLLLEEVIIMGLEAENHSKLMEWQIVTLSGMQRQTSNQGSNFNRSKIELFLRAADSAFPYMDLSDTMMSDEQETQKLIDDGEKVKEILKMNPGMTAEEFLKLKI